MIERIIAKDRFPQGRLPEMLAERLVGWSYSVEETSTNWIIRIFSNSSEADLDLVLNEVEAYPDLSIIRYAEITELVQGQAKPIKVKRGKHEVWCYAAPAVVFLLAQNKLTLGQRVPVTFLEGNRNMPMVIG